MRSDFGGEAMTDTAIDVKVATRRVTVTFMDDREETFVGVTSTHIEDGVLRLFGYREEFGYPDAIYRMWALPLVGIRMWTRELK
jgi:hypothetical protein